MATDYQTGADLTTEKVLDGLGRTIQLRKIGYGQGGQDVVSQTDYDPAGRVKRDYLPGFGAASSAFTEYSYEDSPLSRPISITRPAPLGMETLTYGNENDHFTQTLTNALGEYTQTFTDTRGRKRRTVQGKDGLLNTTQYQYDDRNNLLSVLPDGRTASDVDFIYRYEYDGRNRLIRKKIPEKAWAEYAYDLRDLPTHRQDGIHPVVFSAYDAYGRVTKTGTVSSLSSTTFVHVLSETEFKSAGLGFGQPYKNKYALFGANGLPNGAFISSEVTQFDAFHRPVALAGNHILDLAQPTALTTQLSLNARDQITSQTETVHVQGTAYTLAQNYLYDYGGRPTQTQVTWQDSTQTVEQTTAYNALDNPLQTKLGGNLQSMDYSYWAGGFLHNINGGTTGSGGLAPTANDWPTENTNQPLFAKELTYLANGNIANWKQQNRGFAVQNYAYTYDALQRIRTATNGTQSQTYQYKDALGNFSSLTRSDLVRNNGAWNLHDIDALTYAYANPLSSKIQSVADASNHPQGYLPNTGTYTYDANGNTTYDPANQISTVYNYLNLPSKFTKDNGATQEVVYDATGRKWQVREFTASDSLVGSYSHLGSFEFEGNTLNLVRHPSGFIKNLQSTEYQTGRQNGNIQGASIVSTQKITEGKYEAENQITLLPGFEATAHDAFSAEIKPQSPRYQWQYALTDHLGNLRVLFADKNGDGLIRQDTNSGVNEILSIRNYSPFGLELGGSHKNLDYQNPYRFGGKEVDAFSSYLDFGGRWYDSNRSGWNQVDPLADERVWVSPYNFAQNNPINRIDPTGTLDEPCCGGGVSDDPFLFAKLAATAFYDVKHAAYNTILRAVGSDYRADYKVENGREVFETKFTKQAPINSVSAALKETAKAVLDLMVIVPGASMEGKALAKTSKSQTARAAKATVESSTSFVVTPKGEAIAIPKGAIGPSSPQKGSGMSYQGGAGGNGLDSRVSGVRIMDANSNQGKRVNYMNKNGQTVDPSTGKTISNSDKRGHLPLKDF